MSASDTPMTDRLANGTFESIEEELNDLYDLSRYLETELTTANRKLEYWQDLACANRKVAEDKHAKLAAFESVEVPEDVIGFFAENAVGNKVLCIHRTDYDTLLRAYRAQAVRLKEAERLHTELVMEVERKVAEDKHAKLVAFESVEVPEELAQIVFLRQLNNPTQRDKELLAYIDTLLRAYRAQAVRLAAHHDDYPCRVCAALAQKRST